MVDFHSQRPGHDLRYALDGRKMKAMGWEPQLQYDRLKSTIEWTLENDRWLKYKLFVKSFLSKFDNENKKFILPNFLYLLSQGSVNVNFLILN